MHTSAISGKRLMIVALLLVAEGVVFGLAPDMGPKWTILGTLALFQIVATTFWALLSSGAYKRAQHEIQLYDACFSRLEWALVILFEATVAGEDPDSARGRDAYLAWKAQYVDDFGLPVIIEHACRGTLPTPQYAGATLAIHTQGLAAIREITLAAVAAAGIRKVALAPVT